MKQIKIKLTKEQAILIIKTLNISGPTLKATKELLQYCYKNLEDAKFIITKKSELKEKLEPVLIIKKLE